MELPETFTAFDVRPLWPTSDQAYQPAVDQVSPAGWTRTPRPNAVLAPIREAWMSRPREGPRRLTRAGCLQVALLSLPLFQPEENAVWDLHLIRGHQNVKPVPCQDRPRLIAELAEALATYDARYYAATQRGEAWEADIHGIMEHLRMQDKLYTQLYDHNILPRKPVKPAQIAEALMVLDAMTTVLSTAMYHDGIAHVLDEYRLELVQALQDAFVDYGPPARHYPQQAVYYAMASILKALGIENGHDAQIAERLRKRLARVPVANQ